MNTPSHLILNLAGLGSLAPQAKAGIALGAIFPDLPIFGFYLLMKLVYRLPEAQIWSKAYYEQPWYDLVALTHSFPVAFFGLAIALACRSHFGVWFCLSVIAHSCLDLPVHHDDAHRHFFPLSNYRFISPVSYWDPNHHARIMAFLELGLVIAVTPLVIGQLSNGWLRSALVGVEILMSTSYLYFYWF